MTIRYKITKGDLLYANFISLMRNWLNWGIWAVLVALFLYIGIRDETVSDEPLVFKIFIWIFIVGVITIFHFGLNIGVTFTGVLLKNNKGVIGEHKLSITDEGLVETTDFNETLNRWSAYHKTISGKSFLILYVNEQQAHYVPKSRPLLEGDLGAFEIALHEKLLTAELLRTS